MSVSKIIFPERRKDDVSVGLRTLTAKVEIHILGYNDGGGLGGISGYGIHYENDVFAMRPFCYCEGFDCPTCSYSEARGSHYQDRFACLGATPNQNLGEAPNFWHKPSGFRVPWYKWIGRGMCATGEADWPAVLAECLASVPASNEVPS